MTETNTRIILSGADVYCPQDPDVSFFVESGRVFVYIVPWEKQKPGKRIILQEVPAGRMIPAFVFRDGDYKNWRFLFTAAGDADASLEIRRNVATSILKRKFLEQAGIRSYQQEGFENSLAEFYKRESVKDKVFIHKEKRSAPDAKAQAVGVVRNVFDKSTQYDNSGNEAYRVLRFVCTEGRMTLLSMEDVVAQCGQEPQLTDIARASHLICRKVVLEPRWFESDCGCLVGNIGEELVGCAPGKNGKYQIFRTSTGRIEPLTPKTAMKISPQAYSVGRTLPDEVLSVRDVVRFCLQGVTRRDMVPVVVYALVCSLIGVLLPTLNQMIYDEYIPLGDLGNLGQLCLVMLTFMVGNVFFSIVRNLCNFRVTSRMGNELQNAAYHRLFHLPESFFRDYDSADLAGRAAAVGPAASGIGNAVLITGISSLFSLVYLVRMCTYSGALSAVSLGMYLVYILIAVGITALARRGELNVVRADSEAKARLYQYLNGVDKIRMAGVEERALLSYIRPFARQQSEKIKVNRLVSAKQALAGVIGSVFSMVLYLLIVEQRIELSVGAFVAFSSAFGAFTGALNGLADELLEIYQARGAYARFWPIFATQPEDDPSKEAPGELDGRITLDHVSFAYEEGGRRVLNSLCLDIKPGEYLGIVGASGCGKSTLLKLLLGFETPQTGIVMVGGQDLRNMNKAAYRQQLGVVLQNGKLISGSIYENITITAPNATMARVNKAIDQVGLREDIDRMPMGIHTMLSENCNTISGGQQQRILIARAIVSDPRILIFDEATSALDNRTQAIVSSNLDKMNVTRIVVAHRLSTIRNCSRILVLKDGNIAEEGKYDELMARRGLFYALASRQIAE